MNWNWRDLGEGNVWMSIIGATGEDLIVRVRVWRFIILTFKRRFTNVLPTFNWRLPTFTNVLPMFHQRFTDFLPTFYQRFTDVSPTFYRRFTNILPTFDWRFINVLSIFSLLLPTFHWKTYAECRYEFRKLNQSLDHLPYCIV